MLNAMLIGFIVGAGISVFIYLTWEGNWRSTEKHRWTTVRILNNQYRLVRKEAEEINIKNGTFRWNTRNSGIVVSNKEWITWPYAVVTDSDLYIAKTT